MDVLAENEGKIFAAISIARATEFTPPFWDSYFPCLIWDHEGQLTDAERSHVAKSLLQAGCRYAVCGGRFCEKWHLAVDYEYMRQHLDDSEAERDATHVMATSHDGESPDEAALFFVLNTNFDNHYFRRFLVLHVGSGPDRRLVDSAVRRYALNDAV